LGQIERKNEYLIMASFIFKQLEVIVIMVYLPPNNKEERRMIQREILERYINRSKNAQIIVMGDFNCILDPYQDKLHSSEYETFKVDPFIKWLQKQDFEDAFRLINPRSKKFSWTNGKQSTRIDQIWVTDDLIGGLYEADIQDMDIFTGSDHGAVLAKMELGHLISLVSYAELKRENFNRSVFLYDEATKEDWDNYRAEVERILKNKENLIQNLSDPSLTSEEESQKLLDEAWDLISKSILAAAQKMLPKKKIPTILATKLKRRKEIQTIAIRSSIR
jgi:hypothetical protein